jgi:hypothetical protein
MVRPLLCIVVLASCGVSSKGEMGDPGAMGSQGPPGPPGPGQMVQEVLGSGQLVVTSATTAFTLIPGLTTIVNVPAGAVLNVHTDGGLQCTAVGNAFSVVDIAIYIDSLQTTAVRRVVAANTAGIAQMISNWSIGRTFQVTPGSHLVEVRAQYGAPGASDANVSSASAPQLQGVLTATMLMP